MGATASGGNAELQNKRHSQLAHMAMHVRDAKPRRYRPLPGLTETAPGAQLSCPRSHQCRPATHWQTNCTPRFRRQRVRSMPGVLGSAKGSGFPTSAGSYESVFLRQSPSAWTMSQRWPTPMVRSNVAKYDILTPGQIVQAPCQTARFAGCGRLTRRRTSSTCWQGFTRQTSWGGCVPAEWCPRNF